MGWGLTGVLGRWTGRLPPRWFPAALALYVGSGLTFLAYHAAESWEAERIRSEFGHLSTSGVMAVRKELASHLEVLGSVESFYAASQAVGREEFRAFAGSALSRHRVIAELQWVPRVAGPSRGAHEAAARAEGLEGYRIAERDSAGRLVPAGQREEYFPIHYCEPFDPRKVTVGSDLASLPACLGPMERARDNGVPEACPPERPGPAGDASPAVRVFQPIYRNDAPHATPEERQGSLMGFVVAVCRMPRLTDALGRLGLGPIRFDLFDESGPGGRVLLCSYPPGTASGEMPEWGAGGPRAEVPLDFAGRRWSLVCVPTAEIVGPGATVLPGSALIAGALFTAVLTAYLLTLMGRAAHAERLVAARTEELGRANRDLAAEVERRTRVEEALRASQQDLERRVEARTAELSTTVDALRAQIVERVRAEEKVQQQTALQQGINALFREALTCDRVEDVARACLATGERLTESPCGFVCEVNPEGGLDTLASSGPDKGAGEGEGPPPLRNPEVRGIWGTVLREERSLIFNGPAPHPDRQEAVAGQPRPECFLGVPLKQGGKVIGLIGLADRPGGYAAAQQQTAESLAVAFVEALMRKRAEREVRQARDQLEARVRERTAELARSNAELEQFAYVASHDLEEPLRMVTSFLQLLAERCEGKLDAEAHEFIDFAVDGARRMQKLIHALLAYSRLDRRGQEFAPVSCEAVFAQALLNLHAAIADSEAVVTHDPLPTVLADESQLMQVFQNLVGNGVKFRRAEAPRVHVSAERDGRRWRFAVRDNGIGIEPEHRDRVFGIFQRLHTREEYPGTGIGLAVCKKIVERHRGRIWVESTPGQGSTFCFTLPAAGGDRDGSDHTAAG